MIAHSSRFARKAPRRRLLLSSLVVGAVSILGIFIVFRAVATTDEFLTVDYPRHLDYVSGQVTFRGSFAGLDKIEIKINDTKVADAVISGNTWQAAVDFTSVPEGTVVASVGGSGFNPDGTFNSALEFFELQVVKPGAPPGPVLGDLNGDRIIGIIDLSLMLSRWGTADAAADLNKDGSVAIQDLSVLLTRWTR